MPLDILSETRPDKSFILSNGKVLKSLRELQGTLEMIDDHVFASHVNTLKNDFYNWIKDVYGDKQLASEVKEVKSKEELAQLLNQKIQKSIVTYTDPFAMKIHPNAYHAQHSNKVQSRKIVSKKSATIESLGPPPKYEAYASVKEHVEHTSRKSAAKKEKNRPAHKISIVPEHTESVHSSIRAAIPEFAMGLVTGVVAGIILSLII